MKKEVLKNIIEIFIISLILAFSFPSWQIINARTENLEDEIVALSQNLQVYEVNENNITIIDDRYDFNSVSFIVNNISNFTKNGKIYLMFSKISTLDYNNLLIYINEEEYDLSLLLINSNRDYHIFMIDDIQLKPNSYQEYLINYKVKENTPYDKILGKYFDSNIEVVED